MSFSNSGGTLTLPSPTHVHHVDVSAAVKSLRRSISRSPSKFSLARSGSLSSESSQPPPSPSSRSPCRPPFTPAVNEIQTPPACVSPNSNPPSSHSAAHQTTPRPQHSTTQLSTPLRPNIKLSLRSGRFSKPTAATASRPLPRLRASPKSPLKRGLSVASDSGNSTPSSSGSDATGQENGFLAVPGSPRPRNSFDKPFRHSLHLDVSGSSHHSLFRTLDVASDLSPMASHGGLKRSDTAMDLDQPLFGSPVAKRRSLHGVASLSHSASGSNVFDQSASATDLAFEIHDDANQNYELTGSTPAVLDEPMPSSNTSSVMLRRSSSLRKSTLQQRHGERGSWGRRTGAQQLAQLGAEFSTPNVRNRPRLSMDQFVPPNIPRDSPFSSNSPLPNPSVHVLEKASQPHPLSRSLKPSLSGNSLTEDSPGAFPHPFVAEKPRVPINFGKSLPYGTTRPPFEGKETGSQAVMTPKVDQLKPRPRAFMSTGLVSKVNRNPEEDKKLVVPDTPCKKHTNGFATYPPPPGSAIKKTNRSSIGASPSTPANLSLGFGDQPPATFGNPAKGLRLFMSRHARRGSVLGFEGEERKTVSESSEENQTTPDSEIPPTPTKPGLASTLPNLAHNSIESPSISRHPPPLSAVRPYISRELSSSPIEGQPSPKTPQEGMLPPDPSRLFISGHVEGKSFEEKKATAVPVTPTTGLRARRLVTPVNVHGAGRLDLDEYLCKRFARVDPVGKGEFSTVYRVAYPKHSTALARNDSYESPRLAVPGSPAPGTAFAVKKSRHPYHGARDRDLKLKEVRILSSLTAAHHVLRFISSWELNGHLYIQTEYCDEGTLDKFLGNIGRQGRLDDFRIWKILHDLSLGLSEIHNAGFIHLDLKPANVLITFEGILKIGDFGLASPWPAAAGIDAEGDREYIGPEILKGDFDKPADIFSLGLVILEIACNVVLPENGPTWQALRRGDLSDVPSLTSTTSSEAVRDAMGIPLGSEECAGTADGTSYLGTASHPNFGIPKYRPLGEPPCFMVNMHHPSSLDQLVSAMLTPEPQDRVTIGQILEYYGLCWVAGRRRCAATVYEGSWGPDVATTHPACAEDDAVMTDV